MNIFVFLCPFVWIIRYVCSHIAVFQLYNSEDFFGYLSNYRTVIIIIKNTIIIIIIMVIFKCYFSGELIALS